MCDINIIKNRAKEQDLSARLIPAVKVISTKAASKSMKKNTFSVIFSKLFRNSSNRSTISMKVK